MSKGPEPLPQILQITPYKGGEKPAVGHKLSSNENPLGCSPAVAPALTQAARSLEVYPDGAATRLREAIGAAHGLDPERIICGAGSDEIFQMLARAYLAPGDEIVQSEHGFLVYRLVAQQSGAATRSAPELAYTANVDAMLAQVSARTRLVFLANPNNPTGTCLPASEVARLHAGLPDNVLLVLDGAYAEYVDRGDYSDGLDLAREAPNIVVTHTFSKIHGLASLRLGWGFGPASVIDALNRVRGPFNVTGPAQAAGLAALTDVDFVHRSVAHNAGELARITQGLRVLGQEVIASAGNFVLLPCVPSGPLSAPALDAALRARGLYLRRLDAYRLPDALRLSIGSVEANDAVLAAFSDLFRAAA